MKIGIFDSGMGGTTILRAIHDALPGEEYFYLADSKNCPYGEKSDEELYKIVTANVEKLSKWGARLIVIACNTATVKCISRLRKAYPDLEFVGTEPAIKLAAATDTRDILVLATPGTVQSERAHQLVVRNQKPGQNITLLPCPGLADTVEQTIIDSFPLNSGQLSINDYLQIEQIFYSKSPNSTDFTKIEQKLAQILQGYLGTCPNTIQDSAPENTSILGTCPKIIPDSAPENIPNLGTCLKITKTTKNPDIIVLGCTHYSLIKLQIQQFFPDSKLLDGNSAIARRVTEFISKI